MLLLHIQFVEIASQEIVFQQKARTLDPVLEYLSRVTMTFTLLLIRDFALEKLIAMESFQQLQEMEKMGI